MSILQTLTLQGQVKAYTEYGDTIYVYDNGTWSFELEDFTENEITDGFNEDEYLVIDTIHEAQLLSPTATKEVSTNINQFTFKYDHEIWKRVPPGEYNDEAEFAFKYRNKDIWCIIITEETEITKEAILKIARNTLEENLNHKIDVLKTEERSVNGYSILRGALETENAGVKLVFDSYYYSDERGTTQITTWTSTNLWKKYENEIINFLNGIVILEN